MNEWLSHLVGRPRVKEQDFGVRLVWKCPRCAKPQDFRLIESKGNVTILGLEFSRPAVFLDLRCPVCGYEVKVDPSEKSLLDSAAEATRLFKSGSLSADAYQQGIRSLPARFVQTLTALSDVWKCSGCGEENPMAFDSCWKCRSPKATSSVTAVTGDEPLPGPGRGGNAWENW